MLRGYFDGSGIDRASEHLTLTGLIASESVWERFNCSWCEVLQRHQIPEFHTTYAMSLNREFSIKRGWTKEKVERLITDLWNTIGQYRWTKDLSQSSNLLALSCTVVVRDYERAKLENSNLREPAAICTRFCTSLFPIDIDSNLEHPEITLVFDRGEPFLRTIKRNWDKYKNHKDAGWPKQVKDIITGSASTTCGLQAADLVAWTIRKYHSSTASYDPWGITAVVMVEHRSATLDYNTLVKAFPNG